MVADGPGHWSRAPLVRVHQRVPVTSAAPATGNAPRAGARVGAARRGIGRPGDGSIDTRHNVGFLVNAPEKAAGNLRCPRPRCDQTPSQGAAGNTDRRSDHCECRRPREPARSIAEQCRRLNIVSRTLRCVRTVLAGNVRVSRLRQIDFPPTC